MKFHYCGAALGSFFNISQCFMNVELSWEAVGIILNTLLVLVSVLIIDVIVVTTGLCEHPCINWCR